MTAIRILAVSSSRAGNSAYLQTAVPMIKNFLGDQPLKIAFLPFAAVDKNYKAYGNKVHDGLSQLQHNIQTATPHTAKELIAQSDVIMVGGGNTFKLLHDLYSLELMELVKQRVQQGTPYIGWSAGSNVTGRTISTTNDMPIIQPLSFNALGFFPFQINPHYYNVVPKGFHGETRDQRLAEFLLLYPFIPIVCLPEGTALQLKEETLTFIGQPPGLLLTTENENLKRNVINAGENLSALLNG